MRYSKVDPKMVTKINSDTINLQFIQLNYLRYNRRFPSETLESKCSIFHVQILEFPDGPSDDNDIKQIFPPPTSTTH